MFLLEILTNVKPGEDWAAWLVGRACPGKDIGAEVLPEASLCGPLDATLARASEGIPVISLRNRLAGQSTLAM